MDYKTAHIQWLTNTKNFVPKYPADYSRGVSYLETMISLYADPRIPQEMARAMFVSDKNHYNNCYKVIKEVDKLVEKLVPTPNDSWFVTVGFNHDTWNIKDCDKFIRNVLEMDWVIRGKANFELFRSNGEHPHCHFVIETKEPKSRILEKLFRPLYAKKVVFSKNFIDVKPMMDYHHKYIMLDKIEEKMECVKKDIDFRKKNNIPDYEKNW